MLVYKFNVLDLLRENGYNTTRLRREKLLGETSIQSLRDGKMIGHIALDKVCELLEMQPGNIIKYVNTSEEKNTKKSVKKY